MPPPNANANLHIGYALIGALEDIAARYHRLQGDRHYWCLVLTTPVLSRNRCTKNTWPKKVRAAFDFSREELYRQIWDFVAQNRSSFNTVPPPRH